MNLVKFSEAIEALKSGKTIYRQVWEGTKLSLVPGAGVIESYIMATLWNKHIVVWVPTHDDLLSDDWIIGE